MNLSPLVPFLAAASIVLVIPILNAVGVKKFKGVTSTKLFAYPTSLKVFLWVGTLLWMFATFLFILFGVALTKGDWIGCMIVDFFIVGCSAYADKYSVILTKDNLIYGAFVRRVIRYEDISFFEMHKSNSGTRFCVLKFSSGKHTTLSGNLKGFSNLAIMLATKGVRERSATQH